MDDKYPDEPYETDYDDELEDLYDDFEEDLTQAQKDTYNRKAIGMQILDESSEEDVDNIYYLANIKENYCVSLTSVMTYASERISDLYDVGNIYLTPLFQNNKEKEEFIIKKLKEYEDLYGDKPIKYNEKNILRKVYHVPAKYADFAVKYVYTKQEYQKLPFGTLIKKMIVDYKNNRANSKLMSEKDIKRFKELYNDVLNGSRAKNLSWLLNRNQIKVKQYSEEAVDEEDGSIGTVATYMATENYEIMYYIKAVGNILSKKRLTLADQDKLEDLFIKINNFVILAANEYKAEQELNN